LLCIFLSALLKRRLALLVCFTGFCCTLAAAATENPDTPARRVLLTKAEENSLTDSLLDWEEFEDLVTVLEHRVIARTEVFVGKRDERYLKARSGLL